jgi:hypothetical protein
VLLLAVPLSTTQSQNQGGGDIGERAHRQDIERAGPGPSALAAASGPSRRIAGRFGNQPKVRPRRAQWGSVAEFP